ncbi:MAG: beta-galactosidase [Muribaculaceae bacterium]|nr:beta-galactosidase [Muribaculaceae bacterium]
MKNNHRFLSSILIAVFMFTIPMCVKAQTKNYPYVNPTPGEITILASTPFPPGVKSSHQGYEDIVDCGFNLVTEGYSTQNYLHEFSLIGNLKLKYLVASTDFYNGKAKSFVNTFKRNKYVAGWKFKDEPAYKDLATYQKSYQELYQLAPDKLIFMNLFGSLEGDYKKTMKDYKAMVEYVDKMYRPQMLSFDMYPMFIKNGKLSVAYDTFFTALEAMYSVSKQSQRPFWSYVQSMAFKAGTTVRPPANEAYLSFAVFSALAYGAQGIAYWTYAQRKSSSTENYTSALIDLKGNKTKAWYDAKKVNALVKRFNHVFYESNVVEVRHTGSKIYNNTTKLSGAIGPFSSITSGNAGVLVSRIETKSGKFIVLVNHDVTATQKVTLKVAKTKKVADLTDAKETQYGEESQISKTLSKGGIAIFQEI